jgi:hypothetical protein
MFKIHKLGERAALTACAFLAMIRTKGTDGSSVRPKGVRKWSDQRLLHVSSITPKVLMKKNKRRNRNGAETRPKGVL